MLKYLSAILLVCVFFNSPLLFSEEAKKIRLGANRFIPPYVIANSSKQGILVDAAKGVIKEMGFEVEVLLLSNQRIHIEFVKGSIDASVFLPTITREKIELYESKEIIPFKNGFICIEKSKCEAAQKEANTLTIAAFQNATKYVDQNFTDLIKKHKGKYIEVADQKQQVLGLLARDYDVVFMDYRIYEYHLKNIINSKHPYSQKARKMKVHQVLWDNQPKRRVAFRKKELAQKFNEAFDRLEKSGFLNRVYEKYGVSK